MSFSLSIDVTKIDKSLLKEVTKQDGTKAIYLNLICWPNDTGKDKYENDGTVKHSLSKEQRAAGIKSMIIGNYKVKDEAPREQAPIKEVVASIEEEDLSDLPF